MTDPPESRYVPFCVCSGLNVVLMALGFVFYLFEPGPGGPGMGPVSTTWMWLFAFPVMAAFSVERSDLTPFLLVVNPLIYGLVWSLTWRMWKLWRQGPTE